ncbi:MAG: cell division protein FtsL [Gammaproteobacteria bacterium]|nr:cell division protein FtsL [Gammaproteobacteria bacterium]
MNAVAKSVAERGWFANPFAVSFAIPAPGLKATLLLLIIFLNAFALVYIKDVNRRLFMQDQNVMQASSTMNVNYGKLLLEEGTWATQARVQNVAEGQLNMEIPAAKDVVMVKL